MLERHSCAERWLKLGIQRYTFQLFSLFRFTFVTHTHTRLYRIFIQVRRGGKSKKLTRTHTCKKTNHRLRRMHEGRRRLQTHTRKPKARTGGVER